MQARTHCRWRRSVLRRFNFFIISLIALDTIYRLVHLNYSRLVHQSLCFTKNKIYENRLSNHDKKKLDENRNALVKKINKYKSSTTDRRLEASTSQRNRGRP